MKKNLTFALSIFLTMLPLSSYAAKGLEPVVTQTIQSVGGLDGSGDVKGFLVNGSGALIVDATGIVPASNSFYTDLGSTAAATVKGSAGNLISFSASSTSGGDRWLLLHDKATAPVNGNVPVAGFYLPSNSQVVIGTDFFTTTGLEFANGISFCFSTTRLTCTIGTAGDVNVFMTYQ